MAQTGFSKILTYKSDTATAVPAAGDLTNGAGGAELAVNTADKRLFTKDSGGNVVELGTNPSSITLPNGTANGVVYANGSKVLTTGSALTFDGSILSASNSVSGANATFVSTGDYNRIVVTNNKGTAISGFLQANNGGSTVNLGSLTNNPVTFNVNDSEQMRLTSTGLGIGTSSPSYKLEASSGGDTYLGATSTTDSNAAVRNKNNQRDWLVGVIGGSSGSWGIYDVTSATQRLTLNSSGNLGLGVTPSAWGSSWKVIDQTAYAGLAAYSGGTGDYGLVFNAYNDNTNWKYKYTGGESFRYRLNQSGHAWYTAPSGTAGNAITFTQAMTLDASGNLGIGTGSPSQKLEVASSNSAGSYATIRLNSPYYNYFDFVNDGGLAFKRGTSEYMRIDSSGNVGIGTSSPDSGGGAARWLTLNSSSSYTGGVIYQVGGVRQFLQYQDNDNLFAHQGAGSNVGQKFLVGGTERMRIDSSGNVGIGTSSPQAKLSVSASGAQGIEFLTSSATSIGIQSYNRSTSAYIEQAYVGSLFTWTTGGVGERMRIDSSGNVGIGTSSPGTKLQVDGTVMANNYLFATNTSAPGTDAFLYRPGDNTLGFGTASTERMRIDSSGVILLGCTTPPNPGSSTTSSGFAINGTNNNAYVSAKIDNGPAAYWRRDGTDGSVFVFYKGNTNVGNISVTTSATSYVTSSDYRLKENIQPMQGALAVVQQLNPVTYTWKADGSDGQGFIAHELQAVVPDCVTGEKDAVDEEGKPVYQGIDTSFLVATLTKAIQEQQELINQLTARVAQLEGN